MVRRRSSAWPAGFRQHARTVIYAQAGSSRQKEAGLLASHDDAAWCAVVRLGHKPMYILREEHGALYDGRATQRG